MLNCQDRNIKTVARESLRYSFHRCLPNEPTYIDHDNFLSGSTEGPFKNYSKLGNVRFLWRGVRAACRFLSIRLINFEGNVGVQYDKTRKGKPTTLTGSLRELVKDFHSTKLLSKPDQGKVARSLSQDKYANGLRGFPLVMGYASVTGGLYTVPDSIFFQLTKLEANGTIHRNNTDDAIQALKPYPMPFVIAYLLWSQFAGDTI